jgi:hypothetical protein
MARALTLLLLDHFRCRVGRYISLERVIEESKETYSADRSDESMLTAAIRSKVDALWDRFWSGGIANPLTAIEQISYLLFMRRLDALDRKKAEDADYLGKKHVSFFKGHESCRWSRFKNLPGEEMLSHVRDQVFPFIKGLGGEDQPFARSMQDAVFMIPKPSLLVEAVGLIDELYAEVERERADKGQTFHDTQGDLYEYQGLLRPRLRDSRQQVRPLDQPLQGGEARGCPVRPSEGDPSEAAGTGGRDPEGPGRAGGDAAMTSLSLVPLASCCSLVTDGTHYTPTPVDEGIPFLTVKDITDAGLDFDECSRMTPTDFELARKANCSPQLGDVLFSKDGTVGKVHVVTDSRGHPVCSPRQGNARQGQL